MNEQLCLNGPWLLRPSKPGTGNIKEPVAAHVPGTVHTDLLAARLISDPFYRDHEQQQQWIGESDWRYERTFDVSRRFLDNAGKILLEFEGLDTFATVRLNGRRVGVADNMFRCWRFDVTRRLRSGTNTIEVEFASPVRVAEGRAKRSGIRFRAAYFPHRMHIRKAQYAGGWDWGPAFMTCGIWRPVRLMAIGRARIENVQATVRTLTDKRAVLEVEVEVDSLVSVPATARFELSCRTTERLVHKAVATQLEAGRCLIRTRLTVDDPQRWWPNGLGPAALYDLKTMLDIGGDTVDVHEEVIGLRSIELVRDADKQGESFRFRVNGRDVFCKGANWIPGDSFLPRFTPEKYRARLTDARDAHMNMIRVWGGGIYEDPAFYRICDELGLMVWQDFMFACAEYPDDPAMLEAVRPEAEHAVRTLRNHPSIVIWCGNNECEWLCRRRWPDSPRVYGKPIYHELLPEVCRRLDPSRPYWPGSPFGGEDPNDPNQGNQHVWTVWSWWDKPHTYRNWPARFVTEFGFQAMPVSRTVRHFTAKQDRTLISEVLDLHNKMDEGHPRMLKYLAASLGIPRDLDDYIYLSQAYQLEVVKLGVEHWRGRWPTSAGAVFWQLNDCWPVMSWSAIDYFGRPKGLWYASRRFFAPTLVSLRPKSLEPYGPTDLEILICNDTDERSPATIEASSWRLDGRRIRRRRIETRLPANGTRRVARLRYEELGLSDPKNEILHVDLRVGRRLLSENWHAFAPARFMNWSGKKIRVHVRHDRKNLQIDLLSDTVARAVFLDADRWEGRFSDNFLDLLPGRPMTVWWTPASGLPSAAEFRRHLTVRHLGDSRGAKAR